MKSGLMKKRNSLLGFGLFSPALVVLIIGLVFPLVRVLTMSLTTADGLGFDNFSAVLSDASLGEAVIHSLIFTGISTFAHIALGLIFASLLNFDVNPTFVKVMRSAMIVPWAISPVVVAMVFRVLYHPELSILSSLYAKIPLFARGILTNERFALLAVIVINIWYATPFYFLLILARIQSMQKEIYDAAAIDGCNYVKSMLYISLPILKPLIIVLCLYDIVAALNTFDIIWMTTAGGPGSTTEVLATYIYRTAFRDMDFNYAAAMGIILLLIILAACGLIWFIGREKED